MQICFGFIQFTNTKAIHFFHSLVCTCVRLTIALMFSISRWCCSSNISVSRFMFNGCRSWEPTNAHTHKSTAEWQKMDSNCKHLVLSMSTEYEQISMLPGSGLLPASSSDRLSPGRVEGVWPEPWYSSSWASSSSIRSCNSYNTHADIDMNLSDTV